MSKLGKKPITIPKDTKVKVENGKLILTGPKGSKELNINDKIFATSISKDNNLVLKLIEKNEEHNVIWGTTRSILNSAIIGVSSGFEKILLNIQKYGNTTAGTIPLCFWDFEKKFKKGDNLILSAFGGGFTWGSAYIKWSYNS